MNVFLNFVSQLSMQHRILLGLFVLVKILLILMVPLTGDEAYFIVWGQHLSLGYYDHPPAVGWLLATLGLVADNLTWYRSFAFLSAILIAYLLYQLVRMPKDESGTRVDSDSAMWVALAFFVSPISLMFVVTANDTVLVFFSVLGVYFFAKAIHSQKWLDVMLAGLLLGMAFLSKYFAAFMLVGLLAYALWFWKKINLKQLVVMVAIVLLAVLENLYFNATHCWNNILFNFFSRTTQSQFEVQNVISFVVMIVMLLSPIGLWYLGKNRFKTGSSSTLTQGHLDNRTVVVFAAVPLLIILLLVSFTNEVGLHWPLIAVTILYVLYQTLSQQQLVKVYSFNAYLSLFAGMAILVALTMVDQLISPSQKHHVAVYTQPDKVCQFLPKTEPFFTLDYSSQSALSYHCANDDVHVFASKSKFGREDDKLTNFKTMGQQSIGIFVTQEKDIEKVRPFFENLAIKALPVNEETTYYWIEGQNFDYSTYREQVLVPVNEQFYTAPAWFPDIFGPCQFKQKYGFE